MSKVVIICGPTCSGKDESIKKLCEKNTDLNKVIRWTTREKRAGEVDGKDYHFCSENDFNTKLLNGEFLMHEYYGNGMAYATGTEFIDDESDKIWILPSNENPYILERNMVSCGVKKRDILKIVLNAPVGVRIKRYIDRIGETRFTMKDKIEICSRIDRDEGMFIGILEDPEFITLTTHNYTADEVANHINDAIRARF